MMSQVGIFNTLTGKWRNATTGGRPHPGFASYKSATIQDKSYFFGGTCNGLSCLHAELTRLDHSTLTWERIVANNPLKQPMGKQGHGLVAFKRNGVDMLCVFGGFTFFSLGQQQRNPYTQNPGFPSLGWTSELHLFNLQTRMWSSPPATGQSPPPCSDFSFTLIGPDRVLLLGGFQKDRKYVNEIYTLNLTTMRWSKINSPSVPWHNGIGYQTAVCIDGPLFGHPNYPAMLLVIGGKDSNNKTVNQAWLFNVDRNNWMQVPIPNTQLINRLQYSGSVVKIGPQHVRVVLFGGIREWIRGVEVYRQPIIADTVVLELLRSANNEWLVSGAWDHRSIPSKEYIEVVAERLAEDKSYFQLSIKNSHQYITDHQVAVARFQQRVIDAEERTRIAERRTANGEQEETRAQQRLNELQQGVTERERTLQRLRLENPRINDADADADLNDHEFNQWTLQNEEIQRLEGDEFRLGQGGWGEVRKADFCGLRVAVKALYGTIRSEHYDRLFRREMKIAAQLRHPNLVKQIGKV